MKPPPFVGLFPSQFPGWGRDDAPVKHRRRDSSTNWEPTGDEYVCDMAFHPNTQHGDYGPCMSVRYSPVGVSGIDRDGNCWVLARDFAYQDGGDGARGLVWVKFPVEAME